MPGMAPNSKRAARYHGSANDELPHELDFEAGDERERPTSESASGSTPAPLPQGGVAGDELSPQSLLREDHARPADGLLRQVSEADIGEGRGLDEAELAELDPVAPAELRRLKRQSATASRSAASAGEKKRPAAEKKSSVKKSAKKKSVASAGTRTAKATTAKTISKSSTAPRARAAARKRAR